MGSRRTAVALPPQAAPSARRPSPDPGPAAFEPHVLRLAKPVLERAESPLPHADTIQQAFGDHDISSVRATVGRDARDAGQMIGANAFTSGEKIGFHRAPDLRLAAHEAAHVVQQRQGVRDPDASHERHADAVADAVASGRSAAPLLGTPSRLQAPTAAPLQMQWAHFQHPNMPAYPTRPHMHPDAPQCDPRALAALDTEFVELKGKRNFEPNDRIADALWCIGTGGSLVNVRFGRLAHGVIRVRAIPQLSIGNPGSRPSLKYETMSDNERIDLTHPSLPGGGFDYPARLRIFVSDSEVTGLVSFWPGDGRVEAIGVEQWARGFSIERMLGWRGLHQIVPGSVTNELRDGVLRFGLSDFAFKLEDTTVLGGIATDGRDTLGGDHGSFSVVDERESFAASAQITGTGITPAPMPLRKVSSRISGSANLSLNLAPVDAFRGRFSGNITGTFAGGMLTLQGTARYTSRRANGSLTVLLAPRFVAWTRVSERLPQGVPNAPTITIGASSAPGYVLVGWGNVDFAVNEWLTGSVSAVLDPDGYITSHGVLRPTREFQFLTDRERLSGGTQLGRTLQGSVTIVPVLGAFEIGGHGTAKLFAEGRIGPGRVSDIEVQGTFSTRPGSVFTASATGRINVSAWGRLRAELGGGIHFSVHGDIVRLGSVDIEGTATGTVRAYAELEPTFERIADPAHPDEARYRITTDLTAAGALDLGLTGRIIIRVAGARVWTIHLGNYQWHVGSLGMRAHISHVIGSHDPINLELSSAEFDDSHWSGTLENLVNIHGERNRSPHDVDLAAASAAPRADTPTSLEKRFTMNGVPHRLWVEHRPHAVIMMRSDPGPLDEKLEAEVDTDTQQAQAQSGDAAAELNDEAAEARRILRESESVERALDAMSSETRETGDVAGLQEIADGLASFGTQFDKSDLAEPAALPPGSTNVEIGPGDRYVITNRAQLDAVRAVAPQLDHPPPALDTREQGWWTQYAGTYFPERLRLIEQDLTRDGHTSREGPQTWDAYKRARAHFDPLRAAKDFQPELRNIILGERGDLDPSRVEIDVGLRSTRRGVSRTTHFADVVITDAANDSIEVYSTKVHDVRAVAEGLDNDADEAVQEWINRTMREDVDEAANKYGYGLEFRRPRAPTPTGGAGGRGSPEHPLFEHELYVSRVNLVWRYSPALIPARFIDDIEAAGREFGVRQRRRSRVQVIFLLRPDPGDSPAP